MLSENILSLRKAKGMSQEELADRLHVVRQTVSKWEKGLSVPDAQMLIEIAAALDTTVNILLGETVPEPETQPTVQELADRLEQLNALLAGRNERRRKFWRIFFIVIEILALACLAQVAGDFFHARQATESLFASSAVIGGADQPTNIYISRFSVRYVYGIVHALIAGFAAFGLFRTRRK